MDVNHFEMFRRHILPSAHDSHNPDLINVSFPKDLVEEKNIEKISRFFEKADCLDRKHLLEIFRDLDLTNRVNYSDRSTVDVVQTVEAFVEQILHTVGKIDPRFTSTLIHSGSFYDGVKIGKPDEFDFTARISALCVPKSMEARFSRRKKGFVYTVVTDTTLMNDFFDFFVKAEEDDVLRKGEIILSVKNIKSHFNNLIDLALKRMDVSKSLLPSEFSWHSLNHGPCATIYATYIAKTSGEMKLDIDIAPTFDLPDVRYTPPVLDMNLASNTFQKYLKETLKTKAKIMLVPFTFDKTHMHDDGKSWTYQYSNTWRVSFNELEKSVFSLLDDDSVEKQMYRVLKLLKEIYIQKSDELVKKAGTQFMKYEEPPSSKLSSVTVEYAGSSTRTVIEPVGTMIQVDESDCSDEDSYSSHESYCYENSDDGVEVLYDRSLYSDTCKSESLENHTSPVKKVDNEIASEEYKSLSTKNGGFSKENAESTVIFDLRSQLEYRSSQPLIKTYYIKMMLFSMMLVFSENDFWKKDNLPDLVLYVVKALYYIYCSKQRVFHNFWFYEMIEHSARPSVSLEILQSIENMVDDLTP